MRSLSAKLIFGLVASLLAVLVGLGWANLRVLRENLETTAVMGEQRMAGIIFQSTRTSMLRNDREQLIEIIRSIAAQPGVQKIRIFSKNGLVQFSTLPGETGTMVDKRADACFLCHSSNQPLEKPRTRDTWRTYYAGSEHLIGLVRPIENEPACSNAACHAHPASQRILGVLDVVLSLESVDQALAAHERRMRAQVAFSAALMILIAGGLVWFLVRRPIKRLTAGVHVLAAHNLSYRFGFRRRDEIGELAGAFDSMAGELETANRTLGGSHPAQDQGPRSGAGKADPLREAGLARPTRGGRGARDQQSAGRHLHLRAPAGEEAGAREADARLAADHPARKPALRRNRKQPAGVRPQAPHRDGR